MEALNNKKIEPLITVFINENSSIVNLAYIVRISDEIMLRGSIFTEITFIADSMLRFLVPSLTKIKRYAKTPLFSIWDMGSEGNKMNVGILIDNQCDEPLIKKRLEKMVGRLFPVHRIK